MPVGAVKGNPCPGEKCHPGHAGQVKDIFNRIALVGHVDGGSFMVGQEFTRGGPRPFGAGRGA